MAGITHTPVVGTAEGSDPTKIRKSNWEADHNIADGTITLAMLAFDVATQIELNALSASLGSAAFTSAGSYEVPLTFSTGLTRIGNTITASGGGGSGTVTSVGLVGTANQLTVTGSSPITISGSWTISIPGSAQLSIAKLTNLTSNGLVTTSGGDGTLSVTSLGSGVATFLSTPSSANLAAALTDEVGTNKIAFTDSPTFVTPTLGVASATSLTTTVLKSATTVAIQTNGTTQAVLFGTDQSLTAGGVVGIGIAPISTYALSVHVATNENLAVRNNAGEVELFAVKDDASAYTSLKIGALGQVTFVPDIWVPNIKVGATSAANAKIDIVGQANATQIKATGYSVTSTGTTSMLDLAGTLNGTGIVDVILSNITKTAANAASTHINFKTSGTSVFSISIADGTVTHGDGANVVVGSTTGTKIGTATSQKLGFYNATPVIQQTDGAALTNNVTVGGTTNQIDDFASLAVYATDAPTIRNNIYQLARKQKIIDDALRAYGLLS